MIDRLRPKLVRLASLTAAALLLASCSGSGGGSSSEGSGDEGADAAPTTTVESTSTTVEPTTTTLADVTEAVEQEVTPAVLDIVDQGAEPRIELRYDVADGVYRSRMSQIESLTQEYNGQPGFGLDAIETITDVETTSVAVDGGYEFAVTYLDIGFGEGTDPSVIEVSGPQLEQLVGITITITVDEHGRLLSQSYGRPAGADGATDFETLMQSIIGQMQLVYPFPAEPMGVGGSWRETRKVESNGISIMQETTYTVVSIDDGLATFEMNSVQRVEPGPIQLPGVPDDVDVSIEAWDLGATGSLATDFTSPTPAADVRFAGTQIMVGGGPEEFRIVQEMDNSSIVTPLP